MKKKNYPLYETTKFRDFRVMTEQAAELHGDETAFSYKKRPNDTETVKVSYNQVKKDVSALGTELVALGLRDKKCAIIGASSIGWVYSYFALTSVGAVTVPIDKELPASEMVTTVERAHCAAVFYGAELGGKLDHIKQNTNASIYVCINGTPTAKDGAAPGRTIEELIASGGKRMAEGDNSYYDYEIDPDRLASIVFTSGTTGKGKGVMLSQTNMVSDMTQGMYNFAITKKTMNLLPPHHTFGSVVNFVGHFAQGSEVYISSGIRYMLKEMQEQKPGHLILVPLFIETIYRRIWATAEKSGSAEKLKKGIKISNALRKVGIDVRRKMFADVLNTFGGELQLLISGGAALNQDIIDFFDAIGITLLNGYGITECSPLISCNRNKLQYKGSVGLPIIGEQVKIKDPDENGEGEICVKGTNVMLGYFEDPAATAAAFDEDGFFRTGDYGKIEVIDGDQWIYITGRLKNLIIFSNGKNVYPEEIETELSRIRGVLEVVVYAGESRNDPQKEVIVAEIYPDYEQLEADGVEDIQAYFNEHVRDTNTRMAPYKKVGLVKVRKTEFLKNTSKKITRFNIDKSID